MSSGVIGRDGGRDTASIFADPGLFVRLRERSVAWRRVVDDVVVLDTQAGQYHAVNAAGSAIWDQLAAGATLAALTEALVASYPSASDRAAADVARFLSDLDASGLLEVTGAPPAPSD